MDDWFLVGLGGASAFVEAILGVGIFLPGEVVVTGIAATMATEQRAALFGAVIVGATLGDHLNYWLGRVLGLRLGRSRLVNRVGRQHWDRAVDIVHRRGAWAIVISRLLPVVRTLMAAVAGVSTMPYRRFALASLAGSVLWSAVWVGAGDVVSNVIANPVLLVPAVAGLLGVLWIRSRRPATTSRRPGDADGLREGAPGDVDMAADGNRRDRAVLDGVVGGGWTDGQQARALGSVEDLTVRGAQSGSGGEPGGAGVGALRAGAGPAPPHAATGEARTHDRHRVGRPNPYAATILQAPPCQV